MESVNTPQELKEAHEAICKLRGIDPESCAGFGLSRYQQIQNRKRDIEDAAIERGDIDSEGSVYIHEIPKQASEKSIQKASELAKKSKFNNSGVRK